MLGEFSPLHSEKLFFAKSNPEGVNGGEGSLRQRVIKQLDAAVCHESNPLKGSHISATLAAQPGTHTDTESRRKTAFQVWLVDEAQPRVTYRAPVWQVSPKTRTSSNFQSESSKKKRKYRKQFCLFARRGHPLSTTRFNRRSPAAETCPVGEISVEGIRLTFLGFSRVSTSLPFTPSFSLLSSALPGRMEIFQRSQF